MTLRQLWVRIQALPADSPLFQRIRERLDEDRKQQEIDDIDATLAMIQRTKEG